MAASPDSLVAAPREPAVGDRLGPYRLEALAGEGGMGRVFRAVHTRLGRTVALKVLQRRYAARPDAVARFFREARAVNVIAHPGLVQITDFVEGAAGAPSYYIMEWLDGETLAARLEREGPLAADEVIAIGRQVAQALGAAHRAGFVHRDITPGNLFLVEQDGRLRVVVLDFGIAQLDGETDRRIVGTPAYFSPEAAAGRAVDARSDVYSLGVVLYQAAAGRLPFDGRAVSELALHHLRTPAPPLPRFVPRPLARTIEGCLAKRPDRRCSTMNELEATFAAMQQGTLRAWPWVAAAAAVALVVVGLTLARAPRRRPASPPPPVVALASPRPKALPPPPAAPPPVPSPAPPYPLRVTSIPAGASLLVDGRAAGATPIVLQLPAGPHQLELRRDGFVPALRIVDRRSGPLELRLTPAPRPRPPVARDSTIDPFARP